VVILHAENFRSFNVLTVSSRAAWSPDACRALAWSILVTDTLSDLAALFASNPDAARGVAAAYQALLGGVPTQEGFTYLINNAIDTNYGSLRTDVAFNAENIFINLANSLVQGNSDAQARFETLTGGATSLAGQVEALYRVFVPADAQTAEGLAYLTRPEALSFYASVAAERGVAGDDGAAIVALASLLKILVDHDLLDIGDDVNDLMAAVADGTAQLSSSGLVDIDVADGNAHDGDERDIVPPTVEVEAANTSLRPGGSTTITFDFSEAVKGFELSDLTITGGTLTNLVQSTEDPSIYTATFTAGEQPGRAGITLNGPYQDLAGNDGTGDAIELTIRDDSTNPVNNKPDATGDSYTLDEDTVLTVDSPGVLANDGDADGDVLSAMLVEGVKNGTLVLNRDGSFTYTPNADFSGADSFTYRAHDGTAGGNVVTVNLTVVHESSEGSPPVAVADNYAVERGGSLTVSAAEGLLRNDTDADGDPLTAVLVDGPSHGTLALKADGSFSYTPNTEFFGTDSFTYRANDGTALGNTVTVSLAVGDTNKPPVAVADSYTVDEDTALEIAAAGVLANDTDLDGDALTAILVAGPAHGTLTLNADGSFRYTPGAEFSGADSFTYKANDGTADGNTVTVDLTVTAVNDAPVAVADSYTLSEDGALTVEGSQSVLANDTDAEGDPLTATLVSGPSNGTLTFNDDGSFSYIPHPDFSGVDTFSYQANDGSLDSNTVVVTLTVADQNDAPITLKESYTATEDTPLVIGAPGVLANDTDPDGDTLTASIVSGPAHGTLTLNADGSFTYTPDTDYYGEDSFLYRAFDGSLYSNDERVLVIVGSTPDVPVGATDSYQVDEDTTLAVSTGGVLGNDTHPDGKPLTAVLVTGPANGTLTLNTDGTFTYVPNGEYSGSDSFTYKPSDGTAEGDPVVVTLTVNAVNDAPVATGDTFTLDEDTSLVVAASGVLGNDTDVDGDALTASLVTGPAHGTLALNADGSFTYTPDENYNGTDSFTYRASDGNLTSSEQTVVLTIDPVPDAPVGAADSYAVDEDTTLVVASGGVLANDMHPDGTPLTSILVSDVTHGTLTFESDGTFTYIPQADFSGIDSFVYRPTDGTTYGDPVVVTITVNPVDDAPVAVADSYMLDEGTTLTVGAPGVQGNDHDVDSTTLSASLFDAPTHGTVVLNADGSFSYTPNGNYNGTDSFTYRLNDGNSDGNTATVTLTINAVNEAPVGANDSYSVDQDETLTVAGPGVLANDTDGDGDPLSALLVSGPANGTLTLNPDGSFSYTPAAGFSGTDSFTYSAKDAVTGSDPVTVTLTVNEVEQPPTALADSYAIDEDTVLTVTGAGVLANDTTGGGPLSAILVSGPANGALTLNPDGSFSYTPDANFAGKDSFTYKASNGTLESTPVTVNLTVNNTGTAHPTQIDLDNIAASIGGFRIAGPAGGAAGFSVASAGDIDNDGRDDVIIGAIYNNPYAFGVYGSATPAAVSLTALSGIGFGITPQVNGDQAGWSVGSAGDVNGDGRDDFIVGAVYNGGSERGAAYVVFGSDARMTSVNLNTIASGVGGFKIAGQETGARAGYSVSAAGDLDRDGYGDVIVGAIYADADGTNSGAAYVVYGSATPASVDLATIAAGAGGFRIIGQAASDQAGNSVSSAGDVDGDGYDDLLIGAQYNSSGNGAAYVVFGSATRPTEINLDQIAGGIGGFKIIGVDGLSGVSVSSAGDIDGDGYDDMIIGAPYSNAGGSLAGAAYVVYGSEVRPTSIHLGNVGAGIGGFRIVGEDDNDWAGWSVSTAGDVNNDGFADFLVGARFQDAGGSNAGAAYLVFGTAARPAVVDLDNIAAGIGGFKIIREQAGDQLGIDVSAAGDVNGDGFDDLLVGAHNADAGGADSGAGYVIYGGDWLV